MAYGSWGTLGQLGAMRPGRGSFRAPGFDPRDVQGQFPYQNDPRLNQIPQDFPPYGQPPQQGMPGLQRPMMPAPQFPMGQPMQPMAQRPGLPEMQAGPRRFRRGF